MKLREHYDWIVLGDHPGALLSAGLAARLGLSVLVLPAFAGKSLVTSRNGAIVDAESNFILGLGRAPRFSGLLHECLSRLGALPAELELIQLDRHHPQIITPSMRLDFGSKKDLRKELFRELGGSWSESLGFLDDYQKEQAEVLSYWLQFPERLTLLAGKKRTAGGSSKFSDIRKRLGHEPRGAKSMNRVGRSTFVHQLAQELGTPELEQALRGLWFGVSQCESEILPLDSLMHLAALAQTGASFRGGGAAYRELLLRLAKRLGAHVPEKAECRRVFIDQGKFTGVQIAQRGNMISGGGAIVGCALDQLKTLVSQSGRSWFKRLKNSPKALGWQFTLCFKVRDAAIVPGVSSRMVWKEAGAPSMEIEVREPADYGLRTQGERFVLTRSVMPFTPETLTGEYQRLVGARMLRQLTELMPFLEEHLLEVYPEFRTSSDLSKVSELQEVYGFTSLEEIPENIRCLSRDWSRGVGSRSGIEGLFVASGESFPEYGSFGGTVAALESVSWLAHRAGLAGPFA